MSYMRWCRAVKAKIDDGRRLVKFVWTHPASRRRRLRAVARSVVWQMWKRVTGRPVDLMLEGGVRLRCHTDSASASLMLYCAGLPDYHEMLFMRRYLRPGDGFIDVGANVGVYTLYAAALVGRCARIESFEPAPKAVRRLRENLKLNGLENVRVCETAVAAESGVVSFTVNDDTINRITQGDPPRLKTVEAQCVRLDDILGADAYAMAKIDVEGAEPLALRGAERLLRTANPPVWLLEMNGELRRYGFTEEDLRDWLAERGYDLALYDADRERFVCPERPWELRANVLAVCRAHWRGVLERTKANLDNVGKG